MSLLGPAASAQTLEPDALPPRQASSGLPVGAVLKQHPTFQRCLLPGSVASVVSNLVWNTGEVSAYTANTVANPGPNGTKILVSAGVITQGLFAGSQMIQTLILPNTDLTACLLSPEGVRSISGPETLQIFSLNVAPD